MKLFFKQQYFFWHDPFNIYDEDGNVLYVAKGDLEWTETLKVSDVQGNIIGKLKEKSFSVAMFDIFVKGKRIGCAGIPGMLFWPWYKYHVDYKGWRVEGDKPLLNYTIYDDLGNSIATVSKNFKTYEINIDDSQDVLSVLMLILAIDSTKRNRQ